MVAHYHDLRRRHLSNAVPPSPPLQPDGHEHGHTLPEHRLPSPSTLIECSAAILSVVYILHPHN